MATPIDIAWAAGFIEGEGSFGNFTTAGVRAAQVQKEPLDRLQKMFGGKIYLHKRNRDNAKNANAKDIWVWYLYGSKAAGAIMSMLCLLSPKRFEQAVSSLNLWKSQSGGGAAKARAKTHCKHGHEFNQANTIFKNDGKHRQCRACKNIDRLRNYYAPKG